MNCVLYLDALILYLFTTIEDLLQADHPHTVFTDQASFHKLFINIFMLDFNASQYQALHKVINNTSYSDNIFAMHDTKDHEDENEIYKP